MDDDTLQHLFDSLAGQELPGGCPDCDAYQEMTELQPGVWSLIVFHDDDCPQWRARNAGTN
jgi:hypothetical protein